MNPTHSNEWWQTLYDETVSDLFLVRTDVDELAATIAFLWRQFGATPGRTVFDQCCGIGSLSIPLAQRGARVLGVDQCEAYIQRAGRDAATLGTACTFERGDASEYVPDSPCHGAFNWGSGFGNADDPVGKHFDAFQLSLGLLEDGARARFVEFDFAAEKKVGIQTTQQQVSVGDRWFLTAAITDGTRISARRFWSNPQGASGVKTC